jgi:hypothetical protein
VLFQVEVFHCTVSDDLRSSFEFFTLEGYMRRGGEKREKEMIERRIEKSGKGRG